MNDEVRVLGSTRSITRENQGNKVRLWWNEWASTIWIEKKKVIFHHLHDLTYCAAKKSKGHDELYRCRSCDAEVPKGLYYQSHLILLDV